MAHAHGKYSAAAGEFCPAYRLFTQFREGEHPTLDHVIGILPKSNSQKLLQLRQ